MASTVTKTVGPCGGGGGSAKDMDTTGITRIVKISIRYGDAIVALIVWFERNGIVEHTDQWGGNNGELTEINLKTNEYITSVKGTVGYMGNLFIVTSLVLETNLAVYGPYGMGGGIPFELPAFGGQIIGFHGRSGTLLDAIGVYVQVTRKLGPCGGSGGSAKDMDLTGITRIVKVSIHHGDTIDAFSVCFIRKGTTECTPLWGGNTGQLTEINLKPNEYITSVGGYVGYMGNLLVVRSLELRTNLAAYGPYGKEVGTPFELSGIGGQIIGFHGRSGAYLDAIGVYVLGGGAISSN